MSRPVPENLIGAWRRESVAIEGGQPFEDSQVIWLQAPTYFVDLRLALPGEGAAPEAFGGVVDWAAPHLRFHHDVDLNGHAAEDVGALSWDGEVLVERGVAVFGEDSIEFEERWIRQAGGNGTFAVLGRFDDSGNLAGLAVRCGHHALFVDSGARFVGRYFVSGEEGWRSAWGLGDTTEWPFPKEIEVGDDLVVDGQTWSCVDASG